MVDLYNPNLILDPKTLVMGSLVTSHFFEVPHYQRAFQWRDKEELEKLWEDLLWTPSRNFSKEEVVKEPEPHFLGAFVFNVGDEQERTEIGDGQQRLTTFTVLARVILDAVADSDLDEAAKTDCLASLRSWLSESVPGGPRNPQIRC